MSARDDVDDLIEAYIASAEEWSALRGPDIGIADRVYVENHRVYQRLRETSAGREGIARVMAHRSSRVRGLAAKHSLASGSGEAVAVLEQIAAGDGIAAISARTALGDHRAGKLHLDW